MCRCFLPFAKSEVVIGGARSIDPGTARPLPPGRRHHKAAVRLHAQLVVHASRVQGMDGEIEVAELGLGELPAGA
jgi:hypothetical protein